MDGLEATRQIRKSIFPRPVIVAVTAAVLEEERKACTDAGMDMSVPPRAALATGNQLAATLKKTSLGRQRNVTLR